MSEETKIQELDLIEDVEEVQLQDEDLVEDVEVETEDSIEEKADGEAETTEEVAEAVVTKAGMINAMYKHMSKLKKEELKAAYDAMMGNDDDEEDEEEDDEEDEPKKESKVKVKESYDFKADLDALVAGNESLTEDFQMKAATIFEAAVKTKISEEIDRLEEQYVQNLEEETASIKAELVEKVDGYLNYVVETWMEENQVAIETGLRAEIAESFMNALKGVFLEHYIDVPESKKDMVDDLVEQVSELEKQLTESVEDNIRLNEQVHGLQRSEIIAEATKTLVATDAAKLVSLVEKIDFEDAETFAKKVDTIKESYFANPIVTKDESVEADSAEEVELSGLMARYSAAISKTVQK